MSQFKTKQFLAIQKEWYQTLAKHGFIDQEKIVGDTHLLTQRSSNAYRQASKVSRNARLEYYRLIAHHLGEEKEISEVDFVVMTMISDGKKIKTISAHLGELGHVSHRQTVRFIIRRWETKWGIREWTLGQMNLKR